MPKRNIGALQVPNYTRKYFYYHELGLNVFMFFENKRGGATQQSGESHRCRVTLYILYRAVCKMGYKLTSILFEMTSLNC